MNLPVETWICVLLTLSYAERIQGVDDLKSDEYYEEYVDDSPLNTTYKLDVPDSFKTYLEHLLAHENSTDEALHEEKVISSKEDLDNQEEKVVAINQEGTNRTDTSPNTYAVVDDTMQSLANGLQVAESLHRNRPKILHPFRNNDISHLLNRLGTGSSVASIRNNGLNRSSSNTKIEGTNNTENITNLTEPEGISTKEFKKLTNSSTSTNKNININNSTEVNNNQEHIHTISTPNSKLIGPGIIGTNLSEQIENNNNNNDKNASANTFPNDSENPKTTTIQTNSSHQTYVNNGSKVAVLKNNTTFSTASPIYKDARNKVLVANSQDKLTTRGVSNLKLEKNPLVNTSAQIKMQDFRNEFGNNSFTGKLSDQIKPLKTNTSFGSSNYTLPGLTNNITVQENNFYSTGTSNQTSNTTKNSYHIPKLSNSEIIRTPKKNSVKNFQQSDLDGINHFSIDKNEKNNKDDEKKAKENLSILRVNSSDKNNTQLMTQLAGLKNPRLFTFDIDDSISEKDRNDHSNFQNLKQSSSINSPRTFTFDIDDSISAKDRNKELKARSLELNLNESINKQINNHNKPNLTSLGINIPTRKPLHFNNSSSVSKTNPKSISSKIENKKSETITNKELQNNESKTSEQKKFSNVNNADQINNNISENNKPTASSTSHVRGSLNDVLNEPDSMNTEVLSKANNQSRNETGRHPIEDLLDALVKVNHSQNILKRRRKKKIGNERNSKNGQLDVEKEIATGLDISNKNETEFSFLMNPKTSKIMQKINVGDPSDLNSSKVLRTFNQSEGENIKESNENLVPGKSISSYNDESTFKPYKPKNSVQPDEINNRLQHISLTNQSITKNNSKQAVVNKTSNNNNDYKNIGNTQSMTTVNLTPPLPAKSIYTIEKESVPSEVLKDPNTINKNIRKNYHEEKLPKNKTQNHAPPETNYVENKTTLKPTLSKEEKIKVINHIPVEHSTKPTNWNSAQTTLPNETNTTQNVQSHINKQANITSPTKSEQRKLPEANSFDKKTLMKTAPLKNVLISNDIEHVEHEKFHTPGSKQTVNKNENQTYVNQTTNKIPKQIKPTKQPVSMKKRKRKGRFQSIFLNNKTDINVIEKNNSNQSSNDLKVLLYEIFDILKSHLESSNSTTIKNNLNSNRSQKVHSFYTGKPQVFDSVNGSKYGRIKPSKKVDKFEYTTTLNYMNGGGETFRKSQTDQNNNRKPRVENPSKPLLIQVIRKLNKKAVSELRSLPDKSHHLHSKEAKLVNITNVSKVPKININPIPMKDVNNQPPIDKNLNKTNVVDPIQNDNFGKNIFIETINILNTKFVSKNDKEKYSPLTDRSVVVNQIQNPNKYKDKQIINETKNINGKNQLYSINYISKPVRNISKIENTSQYNGAQHRISTIEPFIEKPQNVPTGGKSKTTQINKENSNSIKQPNTNTEQQTVTTTDISNSGQTGLDNISGSPNLNFKPNHKITEKEVDVEFSSGNRSNKNNKENKTKQLNGDAEYPNSRAIQEQNKHKIIFSNKNVSQLLQPEVKVMKNSKPTVTRLIIKPPLNVIKDNRKLLKNTKKISNDAQALDLKKVSKSNVKKYQNNSNNNKTVETNSSILEENQNKYCNESIAKNPRKNGRTHTLLTPLVNNVNNSVEVGLENKIDFAADPLQFQTKKLVNSQKNESDINSKHNSDTSSDVLFGSFKAVKSRNSPNFVLPKRPPNIGNTFTKNNLSNMSNASNELPISKRIKDKEVQKFRTTQKSVKSKVQNTNNKLKADNSDSKDISFKVKDVNKVTNRKRITKKEEVVEVNEKVKENKVLGKSKTVQTIKTEVNSVDYV